MVTFLSKKLTDFLCAKKYIESEKREIWVYGYELIISSLIAVLLVFLVGALIGQAVQAVLFLIAFSLTRKYSGGYHAESYLKCMLLFVFVFLLNAALTVLIMPIYNLGILAGLALLHIFAVLDMAPIENKNKPMSDGEKRVNRVKSIVISSLFISASFIIYFLRADLSLFLSLTLFLTAMLMFAAKEVKNHDKG